MSWPREPESHFPSPVAGRSTFGMVHRACALNGVSFQSEGDGKIEIRFVNSPTGLTVKFH